MKFVRVDGRAVVTHRPTLLVVEDGRFWVEIYEPDESSDKHEVRQAEYNRLRVERGLDKET